MVFDTKTTALTIRWSQVRVLVVPLDAKPEHQSSANLISVIIPPIDFESSFGRLEPGRGA